MNASLRMLAAAASVLVPALCNAASLDLLWDANPQNPAGPTDSINFIVTPPGMGTSSGTTSPDRYHGIAGNLVDLTFADLVDGTDGSLYTYCYELTQYFSGGDTVRYVLNSAGVSAATLDFLGAVNSVLGNGTNPYAWLYPMGPRVLGPNSIPAVNIAAAIQIGLWETRYDSSWDLSAGAFSASGIDAPTTNALTAFRDAMANTDSLGTAFVVRLENPDRQDQITARRVTSAQQVPEPGSLALLALAAPLALLARRQRGCQVQQARPRNR
ncbi:MAG: PEP-CTERM sorting domain-containing protein [Betaproteobacteria bacterium]